MKDYGKVKTFRLDKNYEKLLNECFSLLNIKPDKFNVAMRSFIERTHRQLRDNDRLHTQIEQQATQIKELESKLRANHSHVLTVQKPKTLMKPTDEPKAECVRGLKTSQWQYACKICRDRHPLDYAKCNAPQKRLYSKPKILEAS